MKGATHEIKYRYTCENCGKQTDWIPSTIEEDTEAYADLEIISSIVDKNRFKKQLQKFREKVEGGNYDYHFMGGSACPFCGTHQSWLPAAGRIFSPVARIVMYMCGWFFIGLIFVIAIPILQREADMLEWLPWRSETVFIFAMPLVGLWLAIRRNRINRRKNDELHSAAKTHNKPEIDWNGIEQEK